MNQASRIVETLTTPGASYTVYTGSITQPVEALVASVLADEWTIKIDTESTLNLVHEKHALDLLFTKVTVTNVGEVYTSSYIRICDAAWMSRAEQRYVDEHLSDWWAKRSKALDAERRAEARNKYMILVKGANEQT